MKIKESKCDMTSEGGKKQKEKNQESQEKNMRKYFAF